MTLKIEVLREISEIDRLREEWEVIAKAVDAWFFQKYPYFVATFLNIAPKTSTPFLITMRDSAGKLVALFPWIERASQKSFVPYKLIGPVYHDHTYLNDVIVLPEAMERVAQEFDLFSKSLPINCFIFMPGVKTNSSFAQLYKKCLSLKGAVSTMGRSSLIQQPLQGDVVNLRKSTIRNMKRLSNKAEREGAPRFEFVLGGKITPEHYQCFLDVEASGWKGGQGSAINLDSNLSKLYQDFIRLSKSETQLGFYFYNDEAIGVNFAFIDGNKMSIPKVGYKEAFGKLSPTQMLIYRTILNEKIDENLQSISFITYYPWHETWTNIQDQVDAYLLSSQSVIGFCLKYSYRLKNKIKALLKKK